MQAHVYARFCEHLVPDWLKRQIMPRLLPEKNPYLPANDRMGAIFVHIPKTAGTSIAMALFDSPSRHIAISRYYAYDPARAAQSFKFCFVRNPWDRMVSAFFYLSRAMKLNQSFDARWATANLGGYDGFEDFILSLENPLVRQRILSFIHFIPQHRWITLPFSSTVRMDFIGRFETLEADFDSLTRRLDLACAMPSRRIGEHPDYRACYSAQTRDVVARLYAHDSALLGYGFDGPAAR